MSNVVIGGGGGGGGGGRAELNRLIFNARNTGNVCLMFI